MYRPTPWFIATFSVTTIAWMGTCLCSLSVPLHNRHVVGVHAGSLFWRDDSDFPTTPCRVYVHSFTCRTTVRFEQRREKVVAVSLPIGYALIPAAFACVVGMFWPKPASNCTHCHYSFRGLAPGSPCPECGQPCPVAGEQLDPAAAGPLRGR